MTTIGRSAGLFSGIGGLEGPLRESGFRTVLVADNARAAQAVLRARFPETDVVGDVRDLQRLPAVEVLTAGFPCNDLSQAGRKSGIQGAQSSLVGEVFRLLASCDPRWVVLENVRNMLSLGGGGAMDLLIEEFERLGFRWAYRLVDSRFTGVPQRRHRVIFVASRSDDPMRVLFADNAKPRVKSDKRYHDDAFGFYWTEGRRGLGWAVDGVPPLKGSSSIGIPSPPAVWLPGAATPGRFVTPSITSAEAIQGFAEGWTLPADHIGRGARWKLVGNAVTWGVGSWVAKRLLEQDDVVPAVEEWPGGGKWPTAAAGYCSTTGKRRRETVAASTWPVDTENTHLRDLLESYGSDPLSHRAASGFLARLTTSRLRCDESFLVDLKDHVERTRGT